MRSVLGVLLVTVISTAMFAVQMLDPFATTTDNVKGLLPDFLQLAGFHNVETMESSSTLLGTLSLYRARKPSFG